MKNILTRSLSGLLLVTIIVFGVVVHHFSFYLLFLAISTLSLWEFYLLVYREKARTQKYFGIAASIIIYTINYIYALNIVDEKIFLLIIPLFLFIFINELYLASKRPFLNISYTIFGLIYITVPFSLLNYIVLSVNNLDIVFNSDILLSIFILIWTYDTFAYLFGVTMGRHRLFPSISPKKSWEGAIGGAIVALLSSFVLEHFFPVLKLENWIVIASIIVVAGTYGDLVESMFKRSINVKDSGNIIPGHGGMLDRFDSFIFAVPFVFIYLQFL